MSKGIEIDAAQTEGPVSVAVTRRIKPGCERAYEELVKGIHEAIKGFEGYLGSHILRPSSADHPEYRIIFRFDTAKHLRAWEESPERREWLDRMSGMIVGTPVYQALSGLETWFTLPGGGPIIPPPRYKMTLVTWIAVFPLLTAFNYAFQPLFLGMPIWLRVLVGTALVVPLMTYVVMPRMTRLFKAWLYPRGDRDRHSRRAASSTCPDQFKVTKVAIENAGLGAVLGREHFHVPSSSRHKRLRQR